MSSPAETREGDVPGAPGLSGDPPDGTSESTHDYRALPAAIMDAQRRLLQKSGESGAWQVSCDGGPTATAMVAVALRFIGELNAPAGAELVTRLRGYLVSCHTLPDGGFPASPAAGTGDLATTALCLAGLVAVGAPDENLKKAAKFIDDRGGIDAVLKLAHGLDLGALALAMVDVIRPDKVPRPPLAFELAPGAAEAVMEQRFAFVLPFRALTTAVVLNQLAASPSWRLPALSFDRLGAGAGAPARMTDAIEQASGRAAARTASLLHGGADAVERAARETGRVAARLTSGTLSAGERLLRGLRRGPGGLLKAIAQSTVEAAGGAYGAAQGALAAVSRAVPNKIDQGLALLRSAQGPRCELYLRRFENSDGSYLYGDAMHTALALAALHALGVPRDDRRFTKGLRWLRTQQAKVGEGVRFDVFSTDVWPTTFALRALLASGVPATDPVITRAANWLISIQRKGSWAFQATNSTTPDADDTAVALAALALVRDGLAQEKAGGTPVSDYLVERCHTAIADAQRWLLDFQNPDGGWASYQQGLPSKPPGAIMMKVPDPPEGARGLLDAILHPRPEFGDPATEDLTGRALFGLGKAGLRADHPKVAAAIEFLRAQQADNKGWWGRWVVNFLAGTAWVLRGLAAVKAPKAGWIDDGVDFLLRHQNQDGGWGETAESYRDLTKVATGDSNPCLTGLVVSALIEQGRGEAPAVERGIVYLLGHFERSGWNVANEHLLHTLFPPNLFYTLPLSELHMPLEALGLHEQPSKRMCRSMLRFEGVPGPADLGALDRQGDPEADAIIELLRSSDAVEPVNAVLRGLMTSVDVPPEGSVPPEVRAFLLQTNRLPAWADEQKIQRAQQLFVRCGWGVGTTLFCSSLPQCYAFARGARVLMSTGRFGANARRRVMETAQLVFDVATPGGLAPGGRGIRTAQKVRLVHAGIRALVRETWPQDGTMPLSQLQMLGTLMTFSSVVTDGLQALGFDVDPDEAEAWFHLWQAVGSILGIPQDLLPDDLAQGQALFDQMRVYAWGPSAEGSELTRVTLEAAHQMIPGHEIDHLADALVRHLAGDHCADLLGVRRTDWTSFLTATSFLDRLKDTVLGDRLPSSTLTTLLQQASFGLMQSLAGQRRDGKGVPFEIPVALQSEWFRDYRSRFRQ
jgi:squalene cyclase